MKDVTSSSLLATLFSCENLHVEVQPHATTASFNLISRILTLPDWKVGPETRRMLLGHECSHAISTPTKAWADAIESKATESEQLIFKDIINVVEDIRINKKIQAKYPGLKRDFFVATKALIEDGFFKSVYDVKTGDIIATDLTIADKINMKYFAPKHPQIFADKLVLNQEEQILCDEAARCASFRDVIAVSEKIWDYMDKTSELEDALKRIHLITVADNIKYLEQVRDETAATSNYLYLKDVNPKDIVFTLDEITQKQDDDDEDFVPETNNKDNNRILVNYMISEFIRHQRAKESMYSKIAITGKVDVNRIWRYKIDDDIFISREIQPVGKNHGFIFVVDCSGSMHDTLPLVLEQLHIMVKFCRAINVPFKSYGFSSDFNRGVHGIMLERFGLIEFFSSDDSVPEFQRKTNLLTGNDSLPFPLGSTPLSSSINGIRKLAENFKNSKKIDILNIIFLTDGECNLSRYYDYYVDPVTHVHFPAEKNIFGKFDNTGPLYRDLRDRLKCNVFCYFIDQHCKNDYLVVDETGGTNSTFFIHPRVFSTTASKKPLVRKLVEHLA